MKHIAIAAAILLYAQFLFAQVQGVELDEPSQIPEFSLLDQHGSTFSNTDLVGSWTLLMFGFNSCPDVCPFTLQNLEAAISESALRLRPDNVPKVVFISVDPARDRNTVTEYAEFFHPEFRGVTGERKDIDQLVEATDSFYRLMPPDSTGFYDVQHSSAVSVVDPKGMIRAKLQPPFNAGMTAEFLARLQIKMRKETNE